MPSRHASPYKAHEQHQDQHAVPTDVMPPCASDAHQFKGTARSVPCSATLPRRRCSKAAKEHEQPAQHPRATLERSCDEEKAQFIEHGMQACSQTKQGQMASVVSRFRTAPPRPRRGSSPSSKPQTAAEMSGAPAKEPWGCDPQNLTAMFMAEPAASHAMKVLPCPTAAVAHGGTHLSSVHMPAPSDGQHQPRHGPVTVHTKSLLLTRPPRRSCRSAAQRPDTASALSAAPRPSSAEPPNQVQQGSPFPDTLQQEEIQSPQSCPAPDEAPPEAMLASSQPPERTTMPSTLLSGHSAALEKVVQPSTTLLPLIAVDRTFTPRAHVLGYEDDIDDDPVAQLLQRCRRVLDTRRRPLQTSTTSTVASTACSVSEYGTVLLVVR